MEWKWMVGRDRAVGIATCYGLDGQEIESRWMWDFPHPYRPILGPNQPSIQYVPCCSWGLSGRGRVFNHPPHLEPSRTVLLLHLWTLARFRVNLRKLARFRLGSQCGYSHDFLTSTDDIIWPWTWSLVLTLFILSEEYLRDSWPKRDGPSVMMSQCQFTHFI
jgi:hypothetical protein